MTKTTNQAVLVKGLKKSYRSGKAKEPVIALDGISLSIPRGEIFGLIGPNGAGKTTLLGCMLSLIKPDQGEIKLFGKQSDYLSVLAQIGYMPERVMFEHWMTARQFLEFHHGLARRSPLSAREEIEQILDRVELAESARARKLKTFSRGMLQRLNLAQALIGKPKLVLLDEPTLGLDPNGVTVVRQVVQDLEREGVTAVINSHHLDEIEKMCSRVAMIKDGQLKSIENLKGDSTTKEYLIKTSWTTSNLNGSLLPSVERACGAAGAKLINLEKLEGCFLVPDRKGAAELLKALIENGVPVDEANPTKRDLASLFSERSREGEEVRQ
ncbi:MAG: ABC transporter ATP-binding protein [Candidatus Obscuribacterales bacterium]|nr:ABC transporter ATP-binding protein [Candidatus Obscuribacterales bacterium]